jgi:hypothetical protein
MGRMGKVGKRRSKAIMTEFQQLLKDKGAVNEGGICESFVEPGQGQQEWSRDAECRTLVLAANANDLGSVVRFTTYPSCTSPHAPYNTSNFSILDVMMAAIPLPTSMPPAEIPLLRSEADGSVDPQNTLTCLAASTAGHANPSFQALIEAEDCDRLWRPSEIHSLVSIGSGVRKRSFKHLGKSLWAHKILSDAGKLYARSVTDPERIEVQLSRHLKTATNIEYYRFEACNGIVSLRIGDWLWTLNPEFERLLNGYFESRMESKNGIRRSRTVEQALLECHENIIGWAGNALGRRSMGRELREAPEIIVPEQNESRETAFVIPLFRIITAILT